MSVQEYYRQSTNFYKKCRVCGKSCEKKELNRGRCSSCNYKNLEPVE